VQPDLTWAEVDDRWPDAGVMWDRDVAPHLDWEPRLRAYGIHLWADDLECEARGFGRCRCLLWSNGSWSTVRHYASTPGAREKSCMIARLNQDLQEGRFHLREQPSYWPDWPEEPRCLACLSRLVAGACRRCSAASRDSD
jgi:hypothetical protein